MCYEKQQWCIEQHKKTNHMYDKYLPYEFHLRMADKVAEKFEYLLDDIHDYFTGEKIYNWKNNQMSLRKACRIAIWGHDTIEDTRVSYNDVKNALGQEAADIIFAVTNEKGKTRKERANAKYYEGIRKTKGGVFVKLCDRIANVQYSKMMRSRQYDMYMKENEEFVAALLLDNMEIGIALAPMFEYLKNLFVD